MSAESQKVLIKKYGNRRLYSTESSSYITLAELEEMVRRGMDIQVIDTKTEEDITAQVLTQILVEGGRAKSIPVDFLEKLIRQRSDMIGSFISRSTENIERSVDTALQLQQEMLELSQKMMKLGAFWPNPFLNVSSMMGKKRANSAEERDEIERLREKVEDLERRLEADSQREQD